jgi:acyl transferase domain-containing protein/acyl carrier protein
MWGSGGGVVLLKRLSDAQRDGDNVRAVLLGNAINNDGSSKVGFTAPSVDGQAVAIANALAVAGIPARTVTYIEAHGTATQIGDPIEVAALRGVYGHGTEEQGWCAIGSVKTNIGHLSQGAGVAGMIKTVLALEHRMIPASLNFRTPNPAIDFESSPFYVNATLSKWERNGTPLRAAVSSFGIGGTNAHLILQQAPDQDPLADELGPQLIQISARDETALASMAQRLADHLEAQPDQSLTDVAYTLRVGRREFGRRAFVVAETGSEAAAVLRDTKRRNESMVPAMPPRLVWMFTGQGAQFSGMGAALYRREAVFAAAVDECAHILHIELGEDIRRAMFTVSSTEGTDSTGGRLAGTELAQPALFTLEYALAKLWESWQVRPDTMIGHSVGEYVAATLAGVFALPDALRLVALRGRLMGAMAPGVMAAIAMDESELKPLLPAGLSIATVNGPGTCVIAGASEAVERFTAGLDRRISVKRLRTSHAFHSPMMDPMLAEFADAVASVPRHAPSAPFLSSVTGEPITAAQAVDPAYWASQVRNTVRFGDCVAWVLAQGPALFVECGPGRQLAGLAGMQAKRQGLPVQAVPSLAGPADKRDDLFYVAAGRLWAAGIYVAPPSAGRRVSLPTYPYQRSRHWIDADPQTTNDVTEISDERLPLRQWFSVPSWRQLPPAVNHDAPPSCLVFEAGQLAEALRSAGSHVVDVVAGEQFGRTSTGFTVRPGHPADYTALLEALDTLPERIVHAWARTSQRAGTDIDAAWAAQELGMFSMSLLVRVLAEAGLTPQIDVITTGTKRVIGDDLTHPEHATLTGVVRSSPMDVPGLRVRHIDSSPATSDSEIVAALSLPFGDTVLALRNRRLWTAGFEQVTLPDAKPHALREGGVYLITGGLGGLGLTIAERLAVDLRAKLVLTSRMPLPPESSWDEGNVDERTGRAITAIRRMTAAGAEVFVTNDDVSDVGALTELRGRIFTRFGRLDGIVHAAGVAGGGMIETRQIADMRAVIAPKMSGTLALRTVFGADELDFVSLFSSITGTMGGLGESDYSGANAFLDAYAQSTHGWSAPVRSVGWAGWSELGMLFDITNITGNDMGEPVAHPMITSLYRNGDTVIGKGTIAPHTHWVLGEHRIDGVSVLPATGQLEAILATAAAARDADAIELTDVLFLELLRVQEGTSARIQVTIRPQGTAMEATLSVGGTNYCRATVDWVSTPRGAPVNVEAIRDRCTPEPDFAGASDKPGGSLVRFGSHWDNIREVWCSAGEQLTLLAIPENLRTDTGEWHLTPAMLDEATFVFEHGRGALPAGYGRVLVRTRMPARAWVYSTFAPAKPGQEVRTHDFTVVDEDGTEVLAVTEFLERLVNDVNRPSSVPAERKPLIAPAEGADAFMRSVNANVGEHVLVVPMSLSWIEMRIQNYARQAMGVGGDGPQHTDVDVTGTTGIESVVAGIWGAVLGVPAVRVEDDFFELGGNSLVAVQLIAQIREATGVRLPMRAIFETPTVSEMAAIVTSMRAELEGAPGGLPDGGQATTIPRLPRNLD